MKNPGRTADVAIAEIAQRNVLAEWLFQVTLNTQGTDVQPWVHAFFNGYRLVGQARVNAPSSRHRGCARCHLVIDFTSGKQGTTR